MFACHINICLSLPLSVLLHGGYLASHVCLLFVSLAFETHLLSATAAAWNLLDFIAVLSFDEYQISGCCCAEKRGSSVMLRRRTPCKLDRLFFKWGHQSMQASGRTTQLLPLPCCYTIRSPRSCRGGQTRDQPKTSCVFCHLPAADLLRNTWPWLAVLGVFPRPILCP
ncbi:hypothetical protein B0H63DRAFT_69989 [Podospora didyma]|uniref:Uncharacterized protein n=1 Tax=Podospora didyma TaxID=330526 RepID=A0AAE0K1W8_9PEZI|nr:hypothetical protein B0H63DRAFT_69989 [Podospora didyma]